MFIRRVVAFGAFFCSLFFFSTAWSQESVPPAKIVVQTETRGLPSALVTYDEADLTGLSAHRLLKTVTPVAFTGLAIGWTAENSHAD